MLRLHVVLPVSWTVGLSTRGCGTLNPRLCRPIPLVGVGLVRRHLPPRRYRGSLVWGRCAEGPMRGAVRAIPSILLVFASTLANPGPRSHPGSNHPEKVQVSRVMSAERASKLSKLVHRKGVAASTV